MTRLAIERLEKRFGNVAALQSISLEVEKGELISLLGPSGCGKTTTLRCVAGFEQPDSGAIRFDGQDMTRLAPEQRDLGMVFQNYALFPHMTVAQNLAFGLEMRRIDRAMVTERVGRALKMVQLESMLDRYPRQLSGGQQQRVALARALVIEPRMLLLDEPLANLDASLREEMRFFIRDLQQRVGITTLYVTHDQSESMVMSDRVVVMFGGRIAQVAAPKVLYAQPATRDVAQFIGRTQFLEGVVQARRDPQHVEVACALGVWVVPADSSLAAGARTLVVVRPEALQLLRVADHGEGHRCRVARTYFLGGSVEHVLEFESGGSLIAHTPPGRDLEPGALARIAVDAHQLWGLPAAEAA